MDTPLTAKRGEITSWRTATRFADRYRHTALELAAYRDINAENLFAEACTSIETAQAAHRQLVNELDGLIDGASAATTLAEVTTAVTTRLYRHFGYFKSAAAFYQLSTRFLECISSLVTAKARLLVDTDVPPLPEMAVIALDTAGRGEYSPVTPLQLIVVHGEIGLEQHSSIDRFCSVLHDLFEQSGVSVDPEITPRNPLWRGTLPEWQRRCAGSAQSDSEGAWFTCLLDQLPLSPAKGLSQEFRQMTTAALRSSRPALAALLVRITSLSHGLNFMGRLKVERHGEERGKFNLREQGISPLGATLSTLALLRGSGAIGSHDRIHDLLQLHELDVEMAERLLTAWHSLHIFQLQQECAHVAEPASVPSLLLDPDELDGDSLHTLKKCLESVGSIQQLAVHSFSGIGE